MWMKPFRYTAGTPTHRYLWINEICWLWLHVATWPGKNKRPSTFCGGKWMNPLQSLGGHWHTVSDLKGFPVFVECNAEKRSMKAWASVLLCKDSTAASWQQSGEAFSWQENGSLNQLQVFFNFRTERMGFGEATASFSRQSSIAYMKTPERSSRDPNMLSKWAVLPPLPWLNSHARSSPFIRAFWRRWIVGRGEIMYIPEGNHRCRVAC